MLPNSEAHRAETPNEASHHLLSADRIHPTEMQVLKSQMLPQLLQQLAARTAAFRGNSSHPSHVPTWAGVTHPGKLLTHVIKKQAWVTYLASTLMS